MSYNDGQMAYFCHKCNGVSPGSTQCENITCPDDPGALPAVFIVAIFALLICLAVMSIIVGALGLNLILNDAFTMPQNHKTSISISLMTVGIVGSISCVKIMLDKLIKYTK